MKAIRKHGAGILALIMVTAVLAGCTGSGSGNGGAATPAPTAAATAAAESQAQKQETTAAEIPEPAGPEPVTISLYLGDVWDTTIIDPSWTDPVALKITELTGISMDVTCVKSDQTDQEIALMMSSGDLPDLIKKGGEGQKKLISGGYVQPLDDLVQEYCPNIVRRLTPFFPDWRAEDGHMYFLGQWGWSEPFGPAVDLNGNGISMRYDVLREIGYEKLSRTKEYDSFITWDEYIDILDRVKEIHPEMLLAVGSTGKSMENMRASFGGRMYGDGIWYNDKPQWLGYNETTRESVLYLNRLYREGYLNQDFATRTLEQNQADISNGEVFSTIGNIAGLQESRNALPTEDNDERRMVIFYLRKDDSVKQVMVTTCFMTGYPAVMVNSNTKHTERIMEFFNWCMSEEGLWLLNAGVEGVSFTMENGELTPTPEFMKIYANWDTNGLKKFGAATWVNEFPSLAGMSPDGGPYDVACQKVYEEDPWVAYNNVEIMKHGVKNIVSPFYGQLSDVSQPEAFEARSRIGAYRDDAITQAIVAKSEAECIAALDKLESQIDTDGLAVLEQAVSDNWYRLAEAYGRSPDKAVLFANED